MREQEKRNNRRKFNNLVFGRQPVMELLESDKTIDKILLQQSAQGEIIPLIKKKAAEKEIPLQYVPVEKLNVLTGGNHQGVIAFIASIEFQSIENILPFIIEKGEVPLLLILDGITDIRNFGAIARTAYASGVHAIIIPVNSAAPVNEDAIKTSAGALTK
ncbi:MAG: TrmH family RNA methyltransferase, partial [Chitinophagales bacterium]